MIENYGIIELEDIELYAYHGCYKEERIKGNKFLVNIKVETDISIPSKTDDIKDAVNYVKILELIKIEMAQPSHLLEHVVSRIINRLFEQFPQIKKVEVKVSKMSPPVDCKVKSVSVTSCKAKTL